MVLIHIISHSLFYGLAVTLYLFLMMITLSPRVWGYQDYPERVKKKVPPQTKKEKTTAALFGIPWFIFVMVFPVVSTFMLKAKLGGDISFLHAFLNPLVLFLLATFGDLVILDWLVVSRITPRFVVIPGSNVEDYKDFSHHYKGHARSAVIMVAVSLVIAAAAVFF
jgi:hypothetical protein